MVYAGEVTCRLNRTPSSAVIVGRHAMVLAARQQALRIKSVVVELRNFLVRLVLLPWQRGRPPLEERTSHPIAQFICRQDAAIMCCFLNEI
ncbi:hypothetical protein TNIN_296941 [Trichonephila inaurata madagascariensis]|uniref:Uncharacterized protein n=1 Tax=Trichonephila inaurata madagascariensis TaxID=2747483 RepID=A0A8X7CAQ3_9ARAC|nr:hypothetical protein TNIN_296941 [Trichonephila inaurata madagascariensis]